MSGGDVQVGRSMTGCPALAAKRIRLESRIERRTGTEGCWTLETVWAD